MALGRPRIEGVEMTVREAVEGHGPAAGEYHAGQESYEIEDMKRARLLPRQQGTQECEGQGEDRMAEADHLQEGAYPCEHHEPPLLQAHPLQWVGFLHSLPGQALCRRERRARCTSAGP